MVDPLHGDNSVAIVGGSLAGLRAAESLRREGFAGSITLIGEETHAPYDRPPLSKQVLAGTWEPERTSLITPAGLDDLALDLRLGHRATSLDSESLRIELDDASIVTADRIVIATGARPRPLPGGPKGIHVLRTLEDAAALRTAALDPEPGRVVIIGAGFIGAEVASTLSGLGCAVTVLEVLAVPLSPIVGEEVGRALSRLYATRDIDLRTAVTIEAIDRIGEGFRITLAGGEAIEADTVLAAIGVVPNTEWLEGSGLELQSGVVTDASLWAAPGIVATGDLARFDWRDEAVRIEHWQTSAEGGVAAARTLMAGPSAPPFDPVPYFWSDQFDLRIQTLGRPGPDDEVVVVDGSLDQDRFVVLYVRQGYVRAVLGLSRPRQVMAYRALVDRRAPLAEALKT